MTFFDHIEELRWHIIRSAVVWLIAAVSIFIYIDWIYDNIILAPANEDFFTYGALCRLGNWLHLGDSFCMPAVKISFQVTEVNGTFTSAISIAMIGGLIIGFPYFFLGTLAFYQARPFYQRKKIWTGKYFLCIPLLFYRCIIWLLPACSFYL